MGRAHRLLENRQIFIYSNCLLFHWLFYAHAADSYMYRYTATFGNRFLNLKMSKLFVFIHPLIHLPRHIKIFLLQAILVCWATSCVHYNKIPKTFNFLLLHFPWRSYFWRTHSPECQCCCLAQNSKICKVFSAVFSREVLFQQNAFPWVSVLLPDSKFTNLYVFSAVFPREVIYLENALNWESVLLPDSK